MQQEADPDKITKKLSDIESSICGLLMDLKTAFCNTLKTDETEAKIDKLGENIASTQSDVHNITSNVKLLNKQLKQLTDSTNKKLSDISKKLDKALKIERADTNTSVKCDKCMCDIHQPSVSVDHTTQPKQTVSTGCTKQIILLPSQTVSELQETGEENNSHNQPESDMEGEHDSDSCTDVNISLNSDTDMDCESENETATKKQNTKRPSSTRKHSNEYEKQKQKPRSYSEVVQSEKDKETTKPQHRADLLIIGNSNTRNIDSTKVYTKKTCKVVTLRNKSVTGAKRYVSGMTLETQKPKCAAFLVGSNDLDRKSMTEIIDDTKDLIKTSRSHMPETKLVLMGIPARRGNPATVTEINDMIEELCQNEQVSFVSNTNISYHNHLARDKVHLNEDGVRLLVTNLKRTVNPLLGIKAIPQEHRTSGSQSRSHPNRSHQEQEDRRNRNKKYYQPKSYYSRDYARTNERRYSNDRRTTPGANPPPPQTQSTLLETGNPAPSLPYHYMPWPYMTPPWTQLTAHPPHMSQPQMFPAHGHTWISNRSY